MKRNIPLLGLVIGIIMPILGLLLIYLIKYQSESFSTFFRGLTTDFNAAATLLSLSLLANIIPFIYYTNRRLDLTARGILIATILYAVLIVLLKFVW